MTELLQMLAFGVLRSGLYALTSVGLALAVGVVGIVNFAHGEYLMLGGFLGYWAHELYGVDPLLSIPLGAVVLYALGAATYRTSIQRVLRAPPLNQMLLTFGISIFLQNMAVILWSGDNRTTPVPYGHLSVALGAIRLGVPQVIVFAVALAVTAALYLLLDRSRVGKAIQAVAQDRLGASLVGIEVERVYLLAFGISTALAGVAGVLLVMQFAISPYVGLLYTLKAFAIIVVAGLGNIRGVVYASLVLGLAEAFVEFYLPGGSGWSEAVFFVLIFVVLIVRPQGLFR
ncbi:MAG: branched-chain amino acid ABC transporter permease [Armatimonadota bacterium]|nr:branched-chain amino acid ABC transporter permease [Armatimonadota bacterium]